MCPQERTDHGREFPAVAAEPPGPGIARARDPLAFEVRLLGALLGQVIAEQAGPELFDLVEGIRRQVIATRRGGTEVAGERAAARERALTEIAERIAALDPPRLEAVARSFSLYFQLVNLAEERDQARTVRPTSPSIEEALAARSAAEEPLRDLLIDPVLTAHPTEARRRTLLVALRRVGRLLERLDDPRLGGDEDTDIRRRLREEITILWRTAEVRAAPPTPLDEVRAGLTFFDESIFVAIPRLYRAVDGALDGRPPTAAPALAADAGRTGTRPPLVPAFVRFGSWIGGDRDGNPTVTADATLHAIRIHADHVLRGYEAVTSRLMQTISVAVPVDRVAGPLTSALLRDAEEIPETARQLSRRFPNEPYRQRFGGMAERLRRTRVALTGQPGPGAGRYPDAAAFDAELGVVQEALAQDGLARVAWGDVADLRWQVATFGFHLAGLEVRQHSAVHRAALAALRDGRPADTALAEGVTLAEVIATLRAMGRIQARHGTDACRRYVVSFTADVDDVEAVLELASAGRRSGHARRRSGARRPAGGLAAARRGAAPRDGGRPRRGRGVPRSTPRDAGVPGPPRRPRRRPGGDARLFRLVQGVRLRRLELAPPPRPAGSCPGGGPPRRPAHPLPRPRRLDRSRRRAGQPGHPRPGRRLRGRAGSSSPSRARSSPPTTPTPSSPAATSSR